MYCFNLSRIVIKVVRLNSRDFITIFSEAWNFISLSLKHENLFMINSSHLFSSSINADIKIFPLSLCLLSLSVNYEYSFTLNWISNYTFLHTLAPSSSHASFCNTMSIPLDACGGKGREIVCFDTISGRHEKRERSRQLRGGHQSEIYSISQHLFFQ